MFQVSKAKYLMKYLYVLYKQKWSFSQAYAFMSSTLKFIVYFFRQY